ncbi:MAG: hypothetical protein ABIG61_14205 [Planctomycetota bacterium]
MKKRLLFIQIILSSFVLLSSLGCSYNAHLLKNGQISPGNKIAVKCIIKDRPSVQVSENGDFVFWATGPGPVMATLAHLINTSNNNKYRKMLKSSLDRDSYSEKFTAAIRQSITEHGFVIEELRKIEKSPLNSGDLSHSSQQKPDFILRLQLAYGIFRSDGRCTAKIQGKLLKASPEKLIWKNQLIFEGHKSADHKLFGDGKDAVQAWVENQDQLQTALEEVIAGAAAMLGSELAGTLPPIEDKPLVKIKLKPGGDIRGHILEESGDRILIRLKGGSLRSFPAGKIVKIN